jgi:hypothetical protein
MRQLLASALGLMLAAGVATAEEPKSGLKPGDFPGAFNVKDVTGPSKGQSLCYRCKFGAQPVVSIFAREVNDELAELVKEVDQTVGQNQGKKMAAFVVLLTDDPDADEAKLAALAKQKNIKNVPLTIYDGIAGPPEYKIAQDADVTVLMWSKNDVKASRAYGKGKLSKETTKEVVGDTQKILD